MTTILDCVSKNLESKELQNEIWRSIKEYCPKLKTCVDCMNVKWVHTWKCHSCNGSLCEDHYDRAHYWGYYYKKCVYAMCDNCCWFEIT